MVQCPGPSMHTNRADWIPLFCLFGHIPICELQLTILRNKSVRTERINYWHKLFDFRYSIEFRSNLLHKTNHFMLLFLCCCGLCKIYLFLTSNNKILTRHIWWWSHAIFNSTCLNMFLLICLTKQKTKTKNILGIVKLWQFVHPQLFMAQLT